MPEDYKKRLYNALKADNYELPEENEFYKSLEDQSVRQRLYNAMKSDNYDVKPFNEFENEIAGFQKEDKPKVSYMDMAVNGSLNSSSPGSKPFITGTPEELNPWENAKNLLKGAINVGISTAESMLKNSYGSAMGGSMSAHNFHDVTEKVPQEEVQKAWNKEGLKRQEFIDKVLPVDPKVANSFAGKMSSGAGSMLGFMGYGFLGGAAGTPEAVISGLVGAFSESRDMELSAYDESLKKGLSEKDAILNSQIAGLAGLPIGATEAFPLERMFGAVKDIKLLKGLIPAESKAASFLSTKMFGKVIKNPNVATALGNAAISFIEEGTQEGIQSLFEDVTANQLYDAGKDILSDMGESALIGGLLGFGMTSIAQTAQKRLEDKKYTSESEKNKLRSVFGLYRESLDKAMGTEEERINRVQGMHTEFVSLLDEGKSLEEALNVLTKDDDVKNAIVSNVQYTPEFQKKQKEIEESVIKEGLRGQEAIEEIAKRTEEELKKDISSVDTFVGQYGLSSFIEGMKLHSYKTKEDIIEELPEESKTINPSVEVSNSVRDIRGELLSPEDNLNTDYTHEEIYGVSDMETEAEVNNIPAAETKESARSMSDWIKIENKFGGDQKAESDWEAQQDGTFVSQDETFSRRSGSNPVPQSKSYRETLGLVQQNTSNSPLEPSGEALSPNATNPMPIKFEVSKGSYTVRNEENAKAADATIAIALDFSTRGEQVTKSYVDKHGKTYIPVTPSKDIEKTAGEIVQKLNKANAKTLNIAGNGIYSFKGASQTKVDDYVYNLLKAVVNHPELKNKIESVRSGGQTGVDEAGVKAASRLGIEATVNAPKGWMYRDINKKDIADEKSFKGRFGNTPKTSQEAPQATISQDSGVSMPQTASELIGLLKEKNLVPQDISLVLDWMGGELKDLGIKFVNDNTVIGGTNTTFGSEKVKGAYRSKGNVIAINLDAVSKSENDIARTLAHEMGHALIYKALRNEKSLHFKKMRLELESLYGDMYKRLTEVDRETYNNDKEELDMVFQADETKRLDEFISAMISKEGALYNYAMSAKADANSSFMQRFIGIIKKYLSRLTTGKREPMFYDQFEFIMNSFMGMPTELNMNNLLETVLPEGYVNENPFLEDDSYNPEDLDSPSAVASVAKLMAESEGRTVTDSYEYIQSMPFESLKSRLSSSVEWNRATDMHFELFYNKKFKTVEDYREALQRRLYNSVMSLSYHPTVRMEFKMVQEPERHLEMVRTTELPKNYLDKDGVLKTGYRPKTRLEELLPALNKIFDADMELVYLDQVKVDNGFGKIVWKELNKKDSFLGGIRNQFYIKALMEKGYVYLGTWSDKSTVVALKMGEKKFSKDMVNSLYEMYSNNSVKVANAFNDKSESMADRAKKFLAPDLYLKQNPDVLPAYIMRGVLEDLRLGGRFNEETRTLESSLFKEGNEDTFDAISIFKRAYLISPKAYVHEDPLEVAKLVKVPMGGVNHGMTLDENGRLQMRSYIFDAFGKGGVTIPVTFHGKTINIPLEKLLVNSLGTPTTDGAVYYVGGGFDRIYHKLHGVMKKGAIKAWISNDFEGSFTAPLYVKAAYHRIDPKSPVGIWMQQNGITLLMSSKSVKVKSESHKKNTGAMKGLMTEAELNERTFQIPFNAMQRDKEKGEAKNGAKGNMQSFSSNLTSPNNPGFVDKGWNPAIYTMANNLTDKFKKTMESLSPAGVLDYMKDKALNAATEQEKAIANIMLDLAYTNIDNRYSDLKDKHEELMNSESPDKEALSKVRDELKDLRLKKMVVTEEQASKIAKLFHEPYFAKGLKSYIKDEIENVTNLKVPATWAVYRPDTGFFEPHIVEEVWQQIEKSYKEETELKVKSLEEYRDMINSQYDWNENSSKTKEESLIKYKKRLEYELKNLKSEDLANATKEEIGKVESEIAKIKENLNQISKEDVEELEKTESEIESLSKEMNAEVHQAEIRKRFESMIDPETGRLKENHTMISQDIADEYNLKAGDEIITNCVPSDGIMALQGVRIAAILPERMVDKGTIMLNSEHTQTRVGKDFDIDTIYVMPYSEYFYSGNPDDPRRHYDNLIESIRESTKEHVKKIVSEYRKVLYNTTVNINGEDVPGNELTESQVFSQEAGLAYMLHTGATPKDGQTLFNPIFQSMGLLNKYFKDVGGVISRRKLLTMKSAIDFNGVQSKNMWRTYLQLMRMTNDNVDMPTNTNNMFYEVNNIKAYDFDHGTDLQGEMGKIQAEIEEVMDKEMTEEKKKSELTRLQYALNRITNRVRVESDIEDFLFKNGAMINSEHNLEDRNAIKDLEVLMRQVKRQQEVNRLLQSEDGIKQLKKTYMSESKLMQKKKNEKSSETINRKQMEEIADEFFDNISFGDLYNSPLLYLADNIPLDIIPKMGITEEEYRMVQNEMIDYFYGMPKMGSILKEREKVLSDNKNKKILATVDKKNEKVIENFLLTSLRPIHRLKAELIATVNPVEQTTEVIGSGNTYYHTVYQEVNAEVYPKLFRILMESKSIDFKERKDKDKDPGMPDAYTVELFGGPMNGIRMFLRRSENDELVITYKPNNKDKVVFRMQDLLNAQPNTDASKVGRWLTTTAFREAKNRKNLSKIIALGGHTIPISERMRLAVELLNREFSVMQIDDKSPKYSDLDRIMMYISLVGKMTEDIGTPANLTTPGKSLKGFSSQDKLLELLGKVSDPVAKRFMKNYAQAFNDSFTKMGVHGFDTIQEVKKIIEEPMSENEDVFFRLSSEALKEKEAKKDAELGIKDLMKNIYSIMNMDKSEITENASGAIGYSIDFNTEGAVIVNSNDVLNGSRSRYHTNQTGRVSITETAFTLSKLLAKQVNARLGDSNLMIGEVERFSKNASKNLGVSVQEAIKRMNDIVEGNTSLRFIKANGKEYIQRKEDDMNFSFDKQGMDEYLKSTRVPEKEYALYRGALEIQRQMSLRNQRTVFTVYNYLNTLRRNFNSSFGYMDMLDSMIYKYEKMFGQMNGTHGHYIPRVYEKSVFEKEIKPVIRNYIKGEVIKNIREEKGRKDRKETYIEKYASMDLPDKRKGKEYNEKAMAAIEEEVEKRLGQEVSNMTKDDHGNYVYAFQMKRTMPERIEKKKLYIRDNLSIFVNHQTELMNMIQGDLNTLNMLRTEFKLRQQGAPDKIVNMMKRWYANTTHHRMFYEEVSKVSDIKEGDGVSFYVNNLNKDGKTYTTSSLKGSVKRMDKDHVYMEVDREGYSKKLRDKIEKYEKVHDDIIRKGFGNKDATGPQMATLENLEAQGYATVSSGMTILGANEEILKALKLMLNDDKNWGKFKKSELMVKQYEGKNLVFKSGVMKHLDPPEKNPYWATAKMMATIAFLGTPGGGMKNLQEAQWSLLRDLNMNASYLKEGKNYAKAFNERKKEGSIRNYEEVLQSLKDITYFGEEEEDLLIKAAADKYVVENDLLGNEIVEQIKTEAKNGEKDKSPEDAVNLKGKVEGYIGKYSKKGFDYINGEPGNIKNRPLRLISKGSGYVIGVKTFGDIEKFVRRQAAYAYALRAVKFDGVRDIKTIESIIDHGVARTQGLYDMMERKLWENKELGKFLFQYSQYPVFQKANYKLGIKQAKMLGISLKDSFQPNVKGSDGEVRKWNSSIDPNIAFKNLFELVMDSYAFTLGNLFGLQLGNPVNKLMVMAPAIMLHWAMGGFDGDDPWGDLFMLATTIGSFFLGIGFTLIPGALYQIFVRGYYTPPRVVTFAKGAYDAVLGEDEATQSKKLSKLNDEVKALTNLDLIPRKSSVYASDQQNYWQTKTPDERLKSLMMQDEDEPYQYEPGIPVPFTGKKLPWMNLIPIANAGSTMK